jgi:hypothetical protein
MNVSEAVEKVESCAQQMNARYGKAVFDEWAIVSLKRGHEKIVNYSGPRREHFQQNFTIDLGPLRAELLTTRHEPGHYNFARHSAGTGVEVFVCVGPELYLICNNTQRTMDDITREERWLEAQKAFAELTECFQRDAIAA